MEQEEKRRGQGRGACQPPASSNYQCEWSMVARAMGLIRALLKWNPSLSSCPTGRLLELNPTLPTASDFPSTQTHSSQWGKTLQTPQFLHNWGALTQWHKTQQFCIQNACLISISVCPSIFFFLILKYKKWLHQKRSLLRAHANICLGIFMRKHCYNMNRSCVHACKMPTASCV